MTKEMGETYEEGKGFLEFRDLLFRKRIGLEQS